MTAQVLFVLLMAVIFGLAIANALVWLAIITALVWIAGFFYRPRGGNWYYW